MYYSGMGLCSGHGNSVVIRELSLYPQSLLAKLTVHIFLTLYTEIVPCSLICNCSAEPALHSCASLGAGLRIGKH